MSAPPTRESRPSAGAAPHKTFRGVTSIVREPVASRVIRAEVSLYCRPCRRSFADVEAAEQHASRGHVVVVTTVTTTVFGSGADVDRAILAQLGVSARG